MTDTTPTPTPLPQVIDLTKDLPKVRAAFENENLGAFEYDTCMYQYPDGSVCGVGALLNPETRLRLSEYKDEDALKSYNTETIWKVSQHCQHIVQVPENILPYLIVLQTLHDDWATSRNLPNHSFSVVRTDFVTAQEIGFDMGVSLNERADYDSNAPTHLIHIDETRKERFERFLKFCEERFT